MYITRAGVAKRVAASSSWTGGRYRTGRLVLKATWETMDDTAEGMLGRLRGLEYLEIFGAAMQYHIGWLNLESLRGQCLSFRLRTRSRVSG